MKLNIDTRFTTAQLKRNKILWSLNTTLDVYNHNVVNTFLPLTLALSAGAFKNQRRE